MVLPWKNKLLVVDPESEERLSLLAGKGYLRFEDEGGNHVKIVVHEIEDRVHLYVPDRVRGWVHVPVPSEGNLAACGLLPTTPARSVEECRSLRLTEVEGVELLPISESPVELTLVNEKDERVSFFLHSVEGDWFLYSKTGWVYLPTQADTWDFLFEN